MSRKSKLSMIPEILLAGLGVFLVIDSFVIKGLTLDYAKYNMSFLDSFVNHGFIGIILIILSAATIYKYRW